MEIGTEFLEFVLAAQRKKVRAATSEIYLTDWLARDRSSPSVQDATAVLLLETPETSDVSVSRAAVSQAAIYPHIFDEGLSKGAAWAELQGGMERLDKCIDAYGDGDIAGVAARLSEVALVLKSVHSKLDRNDPQAALVGFMRRAVLAASPDEVSRSTLESMRSVVRTMQSAPVMSLSEAADLSDQLETNGWNGDEPNASALFQIMFGADVELEKLSAGAILLQG